MGAAGSQTTSKQRSHMEAHLGCTHQVLNSKSVPPHACIHAPEPMDYMYFDWETVTGSKTPWDRIASWSNLEAPRWCKTSQGGVLSWILCGCKAVTSVECHHFIPPLHWACSIAMLTGDEQPVVASRGLWRSMVAGEGKDREHLEGHVLEDLQEEENRFHKNRSNSFCC